MSIDIKRTGTVDVISPKGPLVDEDAEALIENLATALKAANPRFVIDMSEVPYMDSRGVEGLVDAATDLQQRGGRMRLVSVSATCREILEITGQARRVEFFEDTQHAVRSFL
jgi:stage II sporulation protein AA (anti-sigma F factor antagonist)